MQVAYSPLCDTSVPAYIAYCISNGRFPVHHSRVGGPRGSSEHGSIRIDYGCDGYSLSFGDDVAEDRGCICLRGVANKDRLLGGDDSGYGDSDPGSVGVSGVRVHHIRGVAGDSDDSAFVESSRIEVRSELPASELPLSASGRGKHYIKNKKKNLRKKQKRMSSVSSSVDLETSPRLPESGGAFAYCGLETKKELQESRAAMLIAENRARAAKAASTVRHLHMVKESRVNETKFELDRMNVEQKLRKISEIRLGSGFVEGTVCSSAATPVLSSGSVSPNSSISMAEVKRMENLISTLRAEVKTLKTASSVVCSSRLVLTKEEEDLIEDERRVKKEREKYEKFCEVEDSYDY